MRKRSESKVTPMAGASVKPRMLRGERAAAVTIAAALALIAVGCGNPNSVYRNPNAKGKTSSSSRGSTGTTSYEDGTWSGLGTSSSSSGTSSSTTTSSSSAATGSTSSSSTSTGVPPQETRIDAIGATGKGYVWVRVKDRLKVKFRPGLQDKKVSGTGFSPNYSKMSVTLTVGTSNRTTSDLYNGFNQPAQESSVQNFSSSFTKTCGSTATTCRQWVRVTIEKPRYDYWCLNYGMYCDMTDVYSTHPWNGTVIIETDDTDPI